MMNNPWFTVQRIDESTFAISEYGHWEKVHSFLLLGQQKAALIDTGLGIGNIREVTSRLTTLPVCVLTTHVHTDHIGGHGLFSEIYVHEEDCNWLEHGIQGLSIEQIRADLVRNLSLPLPVGFDAATYTPYRGKPAGLLSDGQIIDLGGKSLEVYHTPGHSPGHVCFFEGASGYLFTGDLLYDETPVYAFYPSTSPSDLVRSWERIADIPGVTKIFGSHNTLGLAPEILVEVKLAAKTLREKNLISFGTGTHIFNGFSVRF
ncbi:MULTISPECIES: MBL fold metallo-hydrolase [unclassified Paenibacillus]|uniref:MBL fold metallo-hydrolase n=1 Tax=unclassified Paenibacillus TaxID=185978 RepID=UPI0024050F61|nr:MULTISPECIES: MBL fold metallo-hydrolase [unclassified Paenibacillus]MDF9843380.1 glyoxylase-like metal-dependent hydrolase (beta-lactamase superfamily II) [Paenibacillus sp. PastF-2]MDF9849968.1 glyoxylase-like metal-dependent hydrolase (beta-lactamase superfamily II) [Paenibacillus sp. PastM-2]MDF9856676.1 glyoxylase-like metal-dependent hydrolase (beta-lactamase superfamily II) [Paenibacillus sp. PastF-1]MDH6481945.1 glyoxylase-like metal-dependent hydrolase (beta-lactamase superfamily II